MAISLTLGGVVFNDFEIPESINFGGEQMLVVHKLPGGKRVIDAMGPDDSDIHWTGRFRGPSGEQRAILLDYMRRQGNQILLSWGLHRYQVVIKEFKPDYRQAYEIPYSITCVVVLDEIQSLASTVVGFVEAMASDLVSALGLSSVISNSDITAAVTGVSTALSNYQAGVPNTTNLIAGTTAAIEGPLLNALQTSIAGAQGTVGTVIASTEGTVSTAPVTSGGSPSIMATALSSASSAFGQLGNLYQLSSTLGRMSTNTSNVGK
jgi:hypothetical protein